MSDFPDHFSDMAEAYSLYRPVWPEQLFATLAALDTSLDTAVEVGCGSGQASIGLARHFRHVLALDASAEQIGKAEPHAQITYSVAPAENTGLPDQCADLVLAAQAAHWFRLPEFFAESERLLRPGGVLALASYDRCTVPEAECNRLLQHFHDVAMDEWWPEERKFVTGLYSGIAGQMPFDQLPAPALEIGAEWDLSQLLAYLSTWSAVNRYKRATNSDPLLSLREQLARHWPEDGQQPLRLSWPVTLLLSKRAAK